MRDINPALEADFFALFKEFFDLEKDAGAQHDPANYTLERMTPLAELADFPERRLKVVHIAGTKGKGSTCHAISALIQASGHTVGLFTSPHLTTVRERFQLNNTLISYELLMEKSRELLKRVNAATLPVKPSLFELFTVLALKIFADAGLEYAVMETGIGGLLDATNYIPHPICTVITPVSIDHTALLGTTVREIATQKAGIIKQNIPVVLAKQVYADATQVVLQTAQANRAPIIPLVSETSCAPFFRDNWPPFLRENFQTALTAVNAIGLTPAPESFVMPTLKARCEKISDSPLVVIDAAHNADSIRQLVIALRTLYPTVQFTVVLGVVHGKDIAGICRELKPLEAPVILTNPHTPKQSALDELLTETRAQGLSVIEIIPQLSRKEQLPQDRPLLFTGSFFTAVIGEELFSRR